MITLSELQMKEVIMMHNGRRLGFIDDLEIDEVNGLIRAVIIVERHMKGGAFFHKPTEKLIDWDQIVTIGKDIILVSEWEDAQKISTESNKIE